MHGAAGPLIDPGVVGAVPGLTASVVAALVPQAFVTVTLMVPPAVPAVREMVLVVEVPVQPEGRVQL